MTARTAAFALLMGNFVIGLSIIGPAGMIEPLAFDFGISVANAAVLITYGAIILCIGSPLVAWGVSTFDRRILLAATMAVLAIGHVASALAPSFAILLVIRLVTMAFAAIFTPQAASAISMMVPERERPGAISFLFLGWSLSAAVGMPMVAWVAAEYGWRSVHWALAGVATVAALGVLLSVPRNLRGIAISMASWGQLLRDPFVLILLAATILAGMGQFIIFTFFAPLLSRTMMATPAEVATCFAVLGVAGFIGNVAATRMVGRIGALATSLVFFAALLAGATIWALANGSVTVALIASFVWGLGFASSNSMQQARLAAAAPALAGGAIALNSSSIFIGQASGSAVGGALFDRGQFVVMSWASVTLLAATLALIFLSGRLEKKPS